MSIHSTEIRVYYEDTDAGGIVYYANYLKFAERGRTELLRSAGFENQVLLGTKGLAFVVRHIEAGYHEPARLDDVLIVKTRVADIKNASFDMEQTIYCRNRLLFSMTVKLACVDMNKNGKPVRLPGDLKEALTVKENEQ